MEHRLRTVELGNWRQHATSVASQQNDIAGMVLRYARNLGIADVLDGICAEERLAECFSRIHNGLIGGLYHLVFSVGVASS